MGLQHYEMGPGILAFVKVVLVIGMRFTPEHGKRISHERDRMLLYFDQAKIGEVFKIYNHEPNSMGPLAN